MSSSNESLQILERLDKFKPQNIKSKYSSHVKQQSLPKTTITAMEIFRKQEAAARRSRLECLLIQQFTSKYGSKTPNSMLNALIKDYVKEFFRSTSPSTEVTQPMINELESKIQSKVYKIKEEISSQRSARNVEVPSLSNPNSRGRNSNDQSQTSMTSRTDVSIDPTKWNVINTILAVTEEEKTRSEALEKEKKKERYRLELDQQYEYQQNRKQLIQKEKASLLQESTAEVSKFELLKSMEKKQKEEQLEKERLVNLQMIEERKTIKERERQQKIAMEQLEVARVKKLEIEEEELKLFRKQEKKLAQDRLIVENEKNKAIKAEEKRKQEEEDAKLNKQYAERLEREEKIRSEAFNARLNNLNQIAQRYEARAGQRLRKEAQVEAEKTSLEVQRKQQKDDEIRKQKEDARKTTLCLNAEYNKHVASEKIRLKEVEKQASVLQRMRLEQELALDKANQQRIQERKKAEMLVVKAKLDEQVETKRMNNQMLNVDLTQEEMTINKALLRKIQESPDLLEKVAQKLAPSSGSLLPNAIGGKNNGKQYRSQSQGGGTFPSA